MRPTGSCERRGPKSGAQAYLLFTMSMITVAARRMRVSFKERLPTTSSGGASRDRTGDLKLAKLALSQLSYGPDPDAPAAPAAWWAWEDLNFRPHAYQARALTN
jgi:hypothetical protein